MRRHRESPHLSAWGDTAEREENKMLSDWPGASSAPTVTSAVLGKTATLSLHSPNCEMEIMMAPASREGPMIYSYKTAPHLAEQELGEGCHYDWYYYLDGAKDGLRRG